MIFPSLSGHGKYGISFPTNNRRSLVEMDRLFHLGLRLRDSAGEMVEEHREVVAALEVGDIERLKNSIVRQVTTSRERVMEAILQGQIQPIQI